MPGTPKPGKMDGRKQADKNIYEAREFGKKKREDLEQHGGTPQDKRRKIG